MYRLYIDENMAENVPYTSPHLPVYSRVVTLSLFLNHTIECHWHTDLEFLVILDGDMTYFVDNVRYQLSKGTGIFVNANRLHFGGPGKYEDDCTYAALLLHPSLLCGSPYIEKEFINPLIFDAGSGAIFLSPEKEWQGKLLSHITELAQLTREQPPHYALETQSRFYSLWSILYENTVAVNGSREQKTTAHIKEMVAYIHKHYAEKITLDDVAAAGMMCRSKCCRVFKEILHQTVFEYLLDYRIRRSLPLLPKNTSILRKSPRPAALTAQAIMPRPSEK
ncbi:MAG: AraC family transcriptional regulator [Spirochaetaceae bacterium]|nr:AraC family transcriptional regulator [Spirochaetaceae bacterium]